MKILIEVSARHIHLSAKDMGVLFGSGYQLNKLRDLSQTGQYASRETVKISTATDMIKKVRVVGPLRLQTQLEISITDAYRLKINAPVRRSGEIENSPGLKITGPQGDVNLASGVIIAQRHIHCDPQTAKKLNLKDGQLVSVKTSGQRAVTFHQVIIRIDKDFVWRFQVDTDEANAAGLKGGETGIVIR